ncbi:MAG: TolC family protein [Opitutales bacterium]
MFPRFPSALIGLLVLGLPPGWLMGQADESADSPSLTLATAIREALAANLDIQVERLDREIAGAAVEAEAAIYDPVLFASGSVRNAEQTITFTETEGTESDNRDYRLGVTQAIPLTGASATLDTGLSRRQSNAGVNRSNLSQEADVGLTVRQPLLQDFGRAVNLAALNRARAADQAARLSFRSRILDLLRQTEIAYWSVAFARSRSDLTRTSIQLAENLLAEARAREEVGLATRIDVLQAEAALAARRQEQIDARQAVEEALDNLNRILGRLTPERLPPEPTVAAPPADPAMPATETFDPYWNQVLTTHPDPQIQQAVILQRTEDLRLAKNRARPTLDLSLSGGYNGLDDQEAIDAYDAALDRAGETWSIGLEFRMPWGMQAEKANRLQARKRLEQANLQLADVRQQLFELARSVWRDATLSRQRLEAARRTLALQEAAFAQERSRYDNGLATFREVLEAERDLDAARVSELNARFAVIEAAVGLTGLDGSILQRHGFTWNEALAAAEATAAQP